MAVAGLVWLAGAPLAAQRGNGSVGISIEKATNGRDADAAPGPVIIAGSAVAWTYVVTNTGDVELVNVLLTDAPPAGESCPQTSLQPGESMLCTANGTAQLGQYSNLATVTASAAGGGPVQDSDPSHYFGVDSEIAIQKSTNGQDADLPPGPVVLIGDPIAWSYQVTNSGVRGLTNVSVTDDQLGAVTCPQTTLGVGESMVCSANGTAQAGQYTNVGTASGTIAGPGNVQVSSIDPSHYFGVAQQVLAIEKLTDGVDADTPPGTTLQVGAAVNWDYIVTNTSSTDTVDNITVTDDQGVAVSCPQTSLAPLEAMTCTGSGTVQIGQYANVGTAAGDVQGSPVVASDPSHYYGQLLRLEKSTNGADADTAPGPLLPVGTPITWIYEVINPGPTSLSNLLVVDDQGVTVSCPQTTIAAGETVFCTASGTAEAGQYENLGTATADPPTGSTLSGSDFSHYLGQPLSITKTTNGLDANSPPGPVIRAGNPVLWEYTVSNLGTETITAITVTDDRGVAVTCPQTSLAGGESMVCSGSGPAVTGQYVNIGSATGQYPPGIAVSDADNSHYLGVDDYLDLGDTPAPFPTTFAANGARHVIGAGPYLGACVDSELDGQPAMLADGDDGNPGDTTEGSCATAGDDEDGVVFPVALLFGAPESGPYIEVTASAACTLSAWIDFAGDGDWTDAGDNIFPGGAALAPGLNTLFFTVPQGAVDGISYARFRCTTDGAVSFTGQASDGEVEDYVVTVGPLPDIVATKVDLPGGAAAPGDTISYQVEIENLGGDTVGVVFDDVPDANTALSGAVTTTPLAIDDGPYAAELGVPTTVDGSTQPLLLANDFGIPAPVVVESLGQTTTLGGSVDIAVDGGFTYTPPGGATGGEIDSFTYEVENGIPSGSPVTDMATATLQLGGGPSAQNDFFTVPQGAVVVLDAAADNGAEADFFGAPPGAVDFYGPVGGPLTTAPGTPFALLSGNTVNFTGGTSDGTFTYDGSVNPTAVGFETFEYQITNTSGSDTAVVTIEIQLPPTAVDDGPDMASAPGDAYHTALATTLDSSSHATPPVLANDNLGSPLADLVSYGTSTDPTVVSVPGGATPTDNGGTVVVGADGNFVYTTPSPTFTGPDRFGYRLQNVAGFDDAIVTVAVGIRAACADDPGYTALGNVPIDVPAASGALGNDTGDQLVVTAVQGNGANVGVATATAGGGTVTMAADGGFTYVTAPGDQGADSFTYTVSNGLPDAAQCTVTVTSTDTIWFIDNAAAAGGDGTLAEPYDSLSAYATAALDAAGDIIFVDEGDQTSVDYDTGIVLKANQTLIGQGVDLTTASGVTVPPFSLALPGVATAPSIGNTAGNGITLASGDTVTGLDVFSTAGAAVTGTAVNGGSFELVTISNGTSSGVSLTNATGTFTFTGANSINTTSPATAFNITGATTVNVTYNGDITQSNAAPTVSVSGGHTGTLTFQNGTISATNGTGLQFSDADGVYNFNGTTTLAGGDAGIDILAGSAGTFTFAATTITNPSGTGLNIDNSTAAVTYSGGAIAKNNTGAAVNVATHSGGVVNIGVNINATNGTGLQFSNADGTYNVNLMTGSTTLAGGDAGIDILGGSSGTFTFGNTTITSPTGIGVNVTSSSPNITYSGGSITQNNAATAYHVSGNSGGTQGISVPVVANTSSAAGISLAGGGGAVNFSGGVDIDTTSGTGLTVSGAGFSASFTGTNTLNTATGRGIDVNGATLNATFNNATVTNGGANPAVSLVSTPGTKTFNAMNLTTTTGSGLVATNAGTVQVTGAANTIATTTGTAVNITDTTIGGLGVTFRSVNVQPGATTTNPGIILDDTGAGAFTVTGTGTTAGSGGTLRNIIQDAVRLFNTDGPVSLSNMIIQDIGDTGVAAPGHHGVDGQQVDGGLTLANATIQRVTDSAIHGETGGGGSTTWNGLTLTDSILSFSNRFHVGGVADGGATDEAMVTIEGISGTVSILRNTFSDGPGFVNLFTASSGSVDITVQSNSFTDGRKDLAGVPSVGSSGVRVNNVGAINSAIRIGDPAETNPALGNTFTDTGSDASIFIGGFTPMDTANVDLVISRNTVVVNDHTSPPGTCNTLPTCPFDFPNGGIGVESRGSGTFEAIISNNSLTETQNSGGLSTGSLRVDVSGDDTEVIVRNNTLIRSWDGTLFIRADNADANGARGFLLIQDNTYVGGPIGVLGSGDDLDAFGLANSPSPFLPHRYQVRNGAILDLTVLNDDMVSHDTGTNPQFDSHDMRINGDAVGGTSSTFNVLIQNTEGPEGFRFRNDDSGVDATNSEMNLSRGLSADPAATDINAAQAQSVLDDNANTTGGGATAADVPFSGVNIVTTTPTLPVVTPP